MARRSAQDGLSSEDLLRAILAVLVDQREAAAASRPDQVRTEVLLAGAGLDHQTIAQLLGKNPDAVRMLLSRSQSKKAAPARKTAKKQAAKSTTRSRSNG